MIWYQIKYRISKWKLIDGIYVPVYLRYGYSVLRFIDNGSYECEELNIVKRKLKRPDIVLELGTGIGFIAAHCAKTIGNEMVNTFEANDLMEPVINELFIKNKVQPKFKIAFLGNNQETFLAQKNFLASSEKISSGEGSQIKVPLLNLNSEISRIRPTYLIMDIEGNEFEVFEMIDFQTIFKVQFELHPKLLTESQIDFIFKKLEEQKFKKDSSVSTEKNFYFERKLSVLA